MRWGRGGAEPHSSGPFNIIKIMSPFFLHRGAVLICAKGQISHVNGPKTCERGGNGRMYVEGDNKPPPPPFIRSPPFPVFRPFPPFSVPAPAPPPLPPLLRFACSGSSCVARAYLFRFVYFAPSLCYDLWYLCYWPCSVCWLILVPSLLTASCLLPLFAQVLSGPASICHFPSQFLPPKC